MKHFLALIGLCATILPAQASLVPEPPELSASSYVLFDFHSGQVLAAKEPDLRVEPASITKIMTTYVAFDELKAGNIKLADEVLISEKAWRSEGSRTFVEVGKRVKLENLLHGSIVQSGNDATIAIAEHIAGDESVFAQLMNKHGQRLGLKNTHYTNSTGLPDPELYTTALDVALLSQALIRDFSDLYPWFKEREFTFGHRNEITQRNRNLLLDMDPSADGIKTGHTEAAGYCLAASAIRDGRRLIAVVMGTRSTSERARAAKALLDYGFRFYDTVQLFGADKPAATVRVWKGAAQDLPVGTLAPISLSVPRGASDELQIEPSITDELLAPIEQGRALGTVSVSLQGKLIRTEPLVALQPMAEGSLWQQLTDTVRIWLAN